MHIILRQRGLLYIKKILHSIVSYDFIHSHLDAAHLVVRVHFVNTRVHVRSILKTLYGQTCPFVFGFFKLYLIEAQYILANIYGSYDSV